VIQTSWMAIRATIGWMMRRRMFMISVTFGVICVGVAGCGRFKMPGAVLHPCASDGFLLHLRF